MEASLSDRTSTDLCCFDELHRERAEAHALDSTDPSNTQLFHDHSEPAFSLPQVAHVDEPCNPSVVDCIQADFDHLRNDMEALSTNAQRIQDEVDRLNTRLNTLEATYDLIEFNLHTLLGQPPGVYDPALGCEAGSIG